MRLTSSTGDSVTLPSGRPTILILFAPWCETSASVAGKVVIPLTREVARLGGATIMVDSSDTSGSILPGRTRSQLLTGAVLSDVEKRVLLREYEAAYDLPTPVLYASAIEMRHRFPFYDVGAFPTFIFIRRDGTIQTRALGSLSVRDLMTTFGQIR